MRRLALLLVAVALLALLLWWLLRTQPTPSTDGGTTLDGESVSQFTADTTQATAPSAQPATPGPQPDKLEFLRDLAQKSNRPIRFYGKVIDQDENPIPDVNVRLGIRAAKEPIAGLVGDIFDYQVVTTDAQGRFAIADAKGALLTIKSLEKPGYEASVKTINKSYWYWREPSQVFAPDADAPEIFRMWRKEGAEYLIVKGIGQRIPYDGTPTEFDLLTGRVAAGGDVRISISRNPVRIEWGQRNFDWTATIEVPRGGLILTDDEQMFRAPERGYQSMVAIHVPANAPDWSDMKDVALYLRLRDGKVFGRAILELNVSSDKETVPFKIRSAVNPSGSRNLEYDPAQDIIKDPPPRTATTPPTP